MMMFLSRLIILLGLFSRNGESFAPSPSAKSLKQFVLYGKYDPYEKGPSRNDPFERNKARTDLRNFLTQRSIQSFVYLLNQCRDEHTVKWIEETMEFKSIDSYHGTGAFNTTLFPTWDSFFLDLVTRPVDTVVVTVKRRQRRRGFGPQNNYMDNLGSNVISKPEPPNTTREKRGPLPRRRGFGTGSYLENLSSGSSNADEPKSKKPENTSPVENKTTQPKKPAAGGLGTNSYLENLGNAESKNEQPKERASRKKPRKNPYLEERKIEFEIDIDPASLLTRMISVREQISNEWKNDLETLIQTNDQILVSYVDNQKEARAARGDSDDDDDDDSDGDEEDRVEDLTAPYSDHREDEVIVFDKDAMVMLTNSISNQGKDSSPFRQSNFDLLVLLSTQESVHRVLREYKDEDDRNESFEWLREFYTKRVKGYFDGHQSSYGRADKFLEELLIAPPSIQERKGGEVRFIDPMKMAEDIIKMRSEVAREWKDIVAEVPKEHVDLRRLLLTRRMMERAEPNPLDAIVGTIVEKPTVKTGVVFETGAFE